MKEIEGKTLNRVGSAAAAATALSTDFDGPSGEETDFIGFLRLIKQIVMAQFEQQNRKVESRSSGSPREYVCSALTADCRSSVIRWQCVDSGKLAAPPRCVSWELFSGSPVRRTHARNSAGNDLRFILGWSGSQNIIIIIVVFIAVLLS